MDCDEALESWGGLEPGETLPEALARHLEGCASCREARALQDGLDAAGRGAVFACAPERLAGRILPPRRRAWSWAAAAALLAAAGVWTAWNPSSPAPEHPAATPSALPQAGERLELSPDAELRHLPDGLALLRGRCWLETGDRPLRLSGPVPVTVSPGAELEAAMVPAFPEGLTAWLFPSAVAGEEAGLEISLLAGTVEGPGLALVAGQKASLGPRGASAPSPLTEADRARIEGWRAERLDRLSSRTVCGTVALLPGIPLVLPDPGAPRILAAGFRSSGAHLILRHPHGEAALGSLPSLRDGRWHQLSLLASDVGAEVFVDGRRVLRAPPGRRSVALEGISLEALGGTVELKGLRTGRDSP